MRRRRAVARVTLRERSAWEISKHLLAETVVSMVLTRFRIVVEKKLVKDQRRKVLCL